MRDTTSGEYRAHIQRNRRVFARALLFTLPVIGGFHFVSSRIIPASCCPSPGMLTVGYLFALAAVMMTAGSIFDGIIWVAQKASTPLRRFAFAFVLLALPFFFCPPAALLFPFLLIGILARAGWREGSGHTGVRSDISPVAVATARLLWQALLGAVMALVWSATRDMLRSSMLHDGTFWIGAAVVANAWLWLLILMARTAWRAATEPERNAVRR